MKCNVWEKLCHRIWEIIAVDMGLTTSNVLHEILDILHVIKIVKGRKKVLPAWTQRCFKIVLNVSRRFFLIWGEHGFTKLWIIMPSKLFQELPFVCLVFFSVKLVYESFFHIQVGWTSHQVFHFNYTSWQY